MDTTARDGANRLFSALEKATASPDDFNAIAVITAAMLCQNADARAIQRITHFLQLLLSAIKTYALP